MSTCNSSRKINQPMRRSERIKKLKAKSEAKFPDIPEEILVTILSKLPVKSLLQFRCVSQTWKSLISDPQFNPSSPKEQAIVLSKSYSPYYSICLINEDGSSIRLPKPQPDMVRGRKFCPSWTILGSCNGLVLLSCALDLFLWNPSTRCCKKVLSHVHLPTFDRDINASGLCYDSSTDDYKVVLSCSNRHQEHVDDKVMVGSCRNKTWTEVCLPYDKRYIKSGPIVDERLHFLAIELSDNMIDTTFSIAGFDPETNEFLKVPMPKGNKVQFVHGLGVLDGCLCLSSQTECNESEVEVVVMKKYGDQASWISLFIISNVLDLIGWVPLFFTENAVVFMQPDTSLMRKFCTYNGELNFFQDDIIVETHDCVYDRKAAIFVESLVSPPCYNWGEKEEYTEIFLSGLTRKWRRGQGDAGFKVVDF